MTNRQRLLGGLLITSLLAQAGCGTLLYPERRGQLGGQIDPTVAVLDGLGCLFFVIPGLIAFAIDFTTGAIYLPEGTYSIAPERLQDAVDSDGQIDNYKLKAIIEEQTGRQLPLLHPNLPQQHGSLGQLASLGLRNAG